MEEVQRGKSQQDEHDPTSRRDSQEPKSHELHLLDSFGLLRKQLPRQKLVGQTMHCLSSGYSVPWKALLTGHSLPVLDLQSTPFPGEKQLSLIYSNWGLTKKQESAVAGTTVKDALSYSCKSFHFINHTKLSKTTSCQQIIATLPS